MSTVEPNHDHGAAIHHHHHDVAALAPREHVAAPPLGRVSRSSGFLLQSRHGAQGNFELVVPSLFGGLTHCWRDNDASPAGTWMAPSYFGSGDVEGLSLIQSNFGTFGAGHLEVVACVGGELLLFWRVDGGDFRWRGPFPIMSGVRGTPALIQSSFGARGNFEVVVPAAEGGLLHLWRDNDDPTLPWSAPTPFGGAVGVVTAVSMTQSNLGSSAPLEVLANVGTGSAQLVQFVRSDDGVWEKGTPVPLEPALRPAPGAAVGFTQGRHGTVGNSELVVPLAQGGMAHLWRDNDAPGRPWSAAVVFGANPVSAATLTQSNDGTPGLGNLEVVARAGAEVLHYRRSDEPPFEWSGPTVTPAGDPMGDPAVEGEWRIPYSSGVVGIHAALLHTGNVLFFTYNEPETPKGQTAVLDPVAGTVQHVSLEREIFCAGQALLPDGRVLVAGGTGSGAKALHTFAPKGSSGEWTHLGDLSDERWYPTCTALADGRMLIMSGTKAGGGPGGPVNDTLELFDTVSGLTPPTPAPPLSTTAPFSLYPYVFVLPTGMIAVHCGSATFLLDPVSWTFNAASLPTRRTEPRTYPLQGTCVLLPLAPTTEPAYRPRLMLLGGGGVPQHQTTPATSACEILDLASPSPQWQPATSMHEPRVMPDAVLLPDGTLLACNGSRSGKADDGIEPALPAEIYDPATDRWAVVRSTRVPRLYHSTALLLPDGRVLTAGKDEDFNPDPFKYPEYRIEVFSPPYLFRKNRPTIDTAPAHVSYGESFPVRTAQADAITTAALIRPTAVTHNNNAEQRYVGLNVSARSGSTVELLAPPDARVAPPGHYLFFIVDGSGVPSEGRFVQLS